MCTVFQPIYLSDTTARYFDAGVKAHDKDVTEDAQKIVQHNKVYEKECGVK